MSKVITQQIGCWRVTVHHKSRHSKAEKIALYHIQKVAASFGQLQLDELIDEIKIHLICEYSNGVKETVSLKKEAAAKYANGAVDHYQMSIYGRTGWFLSISEPIGTDIDRHSLHLISEFPNKRK